MPQCATHGTGGDRKRFAWWVQTNESEHGPGERLAICSGFSVRDYAV